MVRLLLLLREVGESNTFDFPGVERRSGARSAFQRGIECILKCQIEVNGKLPPWRAQHDEIDYSPRQARRFELKSLSGAEPVKIVLLLMSLNRPRPEVVRAIEHRDENGTNENWETIQDATTKPQWARGASA